MHTLRFEYSLREITWNLLMVEPLESWTSWPSSSSQNIADGNSPGSCCWCWCSSNRVSFKHICVNSSVCQCLLKPSGNWCWSNWIVRLLKGNNELGAVCSKLGCLFYIYIQSFHWAQGICLIKCLEENFSWWPSLTCFCQTWYDKLDTLSSGLSKSNIQSSDVRSSTCIA